MSTPFYQLQTQYCDEVITPQTGTYPLWPIINSAIMEVHGDSVQGQGFLSKQKKLLRLVEKSFSTVYIPNHFVDEAHFWKNDGYSIVNEEDVVAIHAFCVLAEG